MYTEFICPDGIKVGIEECLTECRLKNEYNLDTGVKYVPAGRCLCSRTLRAIADQRIWNGKPSTTQLLNGTRESYLKIKYDYAINPIDSLYMLLGSGVHAFLESYTRGEEKTEIRIDDGTSTGAFDFYDPEDGGVLVDHKTYGSFKAAKVLGLQEVKIPTGEYYKNGKPKYRKIFLPDGRHDRLDLAIQLNDYRMKIEKELKLPVATMACEIIVRDGNTYMAAQRGVTQAGYLVSVNKISDKYVRAYMDKKASDLAYYLEKDILPPPCKPRERWNGRKCESFCNVSQYCEFGGNK